MNKSEYEQALDEAYGSGMSHFVDKSAWNPILFEEQFGLFQKPHSTGLNIYLAETKIKRNASEIQDFIFNVENWKLWQPFYKHSQILTEYSETCRVSYIRTRHIGMIRSRELILASRKEDIDRYKTIIFTSVEHEFPHIRFKVKGSVHFFSFIIEQSGPEESNVSWLCQYDPKGLGFKKKDTRAVLDFLKNLMVLKEVLDRTEFRTQGMN